MLISPDSRRAKHGREGSMIGQRSSSRRVCRRLAAIAAVLSMLLLAAPPVFTQPAVAQTAPSGNPITIGFSMALTGSLAVNGKSGLLASQIWAEDVNAKGGLLGRPVKLIFYDDQTNPSLVPGIYTKLMDVDKVDLEIGRASCRERGWITLAGERESD